MIETCERRSVRAIRELLLGASLMLLGGCGLALDFDPPDLQRADAGDIDGGRDGHDGGSDASVDPGGDGGASDGAVPIDAAHDAGDGARDSGLDTGVLDAGVVVPCRTSSDCAVTEHCARLLGRCYGEGVCRPRPTACPDVADPVCGCDWESYGNPCEASGAGMNVMQRGACPPRLREWCALPVLAPADEGCGRCFDDEDCGAVFPFCVASACMPGGEGVCAGNPGLGRCHDARQCRETESCVGSVSDVCLPMDGRCVER